MDGVEACPWGLLSLAGTLAVLVVVPSQCVEAVGSYPAVGHDHPSGGSNLPFVLKGCRWLEAMLALSAVGLGVGGVVWSAMHGGDGCLWLHLVSRLLASILLLLPAVTTLAWGQAAPRWSAWGPYALYGMAMLLVAGVGGLYAEKGNAAWAQRDPGLLLEASLLGTLALLAVTKAGAMAIATLAVSPSEDAVRSKRAVHRWARRRPQAPSDGLEAPLLATEAGVHAEKDGTTAKPAEPVAPIDSAGIWSRLVFGWVGPLLRTGAKRQLGFDDVPALGREDETEVWARRFDVALEVERGRSNPSLLRAAHAVFAADFYAFAGLQLINDLLGFSGPVLLKLVVNYVQDFTAGTATLARGCTILVVLVLTYALTAVLSTQYNLRMLRLQLRVRTALVTAIYAQLLRCRAPQLGGLGSGEVINLISLDTQRVQDAASSFNSGWSLPVQVALTLYLLYREVSYAFVAGLIIMVLMVPLNMSIANAITRVTQRQMRFKDQRVQLCDEMLHGIRTLKMLAWEGHLAAALERLRKEEMRCLARRKYLDALCVIFWAATPVLTSLATFVAVVYIDHDITPAAVFTTIALLQMLTFPLNAFPWILNGLMEARVSKRRLQRFLLDVPSPPNYVIRAEAASSKASPGPQSSPNKRRTPTIEGIFRNTGLATGAAGGCYCLEVYGSFAWEEPLLAPPSLPPTPGGDDDDDVDPKLGLAGLARPLPERVVGLEELEGTAEWLLPPADASSDGGKANGAESKGHIGPSEQQQQEPSRGFMLRDLALRVRRGETVGVYGRIGAGKSSLLAAVLGEMYAVPARAGSPASRVVMRAVRVAYVAQSPWLQRGSIRDNIVFGLPWDPVRFEAAVAACGLCPDLAALPGGAEMEVGDGGGTLSGGQRLRVALARALYSRAELYLLDDIFSGLDGRTVAHVAREAVHGMMRREGATVLLVTHTLPLLAGCDWAVAMRGGAVVERIRVRQHENGEGKVRAPPQPCATPRTENGGSVKGQGETEAATSTTLATALATEETRQIGKVRWGMYAYYVTSAGRLLSFVTVLALLAMQLSSNAMSLWLGMWSMHTDRYSASQFLAISGTIAAANAGFTILRSFLFAWGGLHAARHLHDRLLSAVLGASLKFFEANPVGRILNRFAGDTWTVDDSLPFILNILLAQWAALVGTTVVLGLASPWTLLVLLLVSPLYHRLQAFYRASSRELKRLDSVARSPLLAHFSETMAGAQTVRAFGATDRFREHSLALVDANQRVGFYSSAASQWLGLRVQAFGVVVVASVAAWAVGSCAAHRPARAELIGLALSYASGVLGNLGGILNSYAETEREMVAVERVHEFTEEPPERDIVEAPPVEVAPDWPWAGAVRVESLCLRYRPGWPLALDHISVRIRAAEKVGVCGRTGSGKSSLLACLFRLVPWEEGSSIVVDGVPIERVPLQRLRSALSIIPQEPVAFGGTVRSNVDPQGEFDDAVLFRAMQACHLDVVLREHHRHHQHGPEAPGAPPPSLAECLEMEVKEKGLNFSVGQRQLLCLCRALLRRARVVCVDEATASLDAATDALVRRTLASAFNDATVITIAHRTSTVLEICTRVLVLSEGRLVEEGDPRKLLADAGSHLYALSKAEEERGVPTKEEKP